MRQSYKPEELVSILTSLLKKEQEENSHEDGRFKRWISSQKLSDATGWNKRKVRYELDKLAAQKLIDRYKDESWSYMHYSLPSWPGCVRFGVYFKPSI